MPGRGAWNTSGVGGTIDFKRLSAGPYYAFVADQSTLPKVGSKGWNSTDPNERAVHGGVLAIQRAVKRRRPAFTLKADGVYGAKTHAAVMDFQGGMADTKPWGGVGPETAKALLLPDLEKTCKQQGFLYPKIVCGVITQESNWDPGAVGYVDVHDVGLAQINHLAHPEWSERERLQPVTSFKFIIDYLSLSLIAFNNNMEDAIASYNLGIGGAKRWISQGRPEWYTPDGQTAPRNVYSYIKKIVTACQ